MRRKKTSDSVLITLIICITLLAMTISKGGNKNGKK